MRVELLKTVVGCWAAFVLRLSVVVNAVAGVMVAKAVFCLKMRVANETAMRRIRANPIKVLVNFNLAASSLWYYSVVVFNSIRKQMY